MPTHRNNTKIRITKKFSFETSHALHNYDGLCKNIHGHSYKLEVTILGCPIYDSNHVKNGMIIDFGDVKKIIHREIIDIFDHSLLLNKEAPYARDIESKFNENRVILLDYQPTCENMLIDFVEKIKNNLPAQVELAVLKLHETASSYAEWYASDNEDK